MLYLAVSIICITDNGKQQTILAAMQNNTPDILLCAEDDPDDIEMFCQMVKELNSNITVIHSLNGKQLLHHLQELTLSNTLPCLITLDINMPVMDGRETLEQIRANNRWKNIPVVLYTTSPQMINADLQAKYNISIFQKPDNMHDIKSVVTKILSLCRKPA